MSTQKSRLLKVILLGDGGVGKSSLMNRFVIDRFDSNLYHTIGVEFLNRDIEIIVNGKEINVTLQIWDTADGAPFLLSCVFNIGQERFRSLRTPFYRGADCCLLVFGVDDRRSFEELSDWRKEFIHYAGVKDDFPFVVLGNKIDMEEKRQVADEEAINWCRTNTVARPTDLSKEHNADDSIKYYSTSAKDSRGVNDAFIDAARRVLKLSLEQESLLPSQIDSIILKNQNSATGGCAC